MYHTVSVKPFASYRNNTSGCRPKHCAGFAPNIGCEMKEKKKEKKKQLISNLCKAENGKLKRQKWEIYSEQKRLHTVFKDITAPLGTFRYKHLNQEFDTLYLNFSVISTLHMMNHSKPWAWNVTRRDGDLLHTELATASPSPISAQQCSTLISLHGWFRMSLLTVYHSYTAPPGAIRLSMLGLGHAMSSQKSCTPSHSHVSFVRY